MISTVGTKLFMAPELVRNKNFNEKIDLWGVGCCLCLLLTGKLPANGSDVSPESSPFEFMELSEIEK
jgi:serine/threonine protein kinase